MDPELLALEGESHSSSDMTYASRKLLVKGYRQWSVVRASGQWPVVSALRTFLVQHEGTERCTFSYISARSLHVLILERPSAIVAAV